MRRYCRVFQNILHSPAMKIISMVDILRNLISGVKHKIKVNIKVKVESAYEPSDQTGQSLSRFL